ncbi:MULTISPECIES: bifunctional sugar phosphate isomerase/epimerase/4-hydroxyphenylpyruvate dioxygenase family protein [Streptomyces]|uniref:3-dehydroshikimate dehydratase n=1 Tax=Streptomyces glycanivorans TaxID=3033808 RepID=A0ABY9JGG3_9ACTN|nr:MULTISPECIES: sugar phosphate isomerase/epimerase and 4-hydroxyphenylpyruvate domain-containing protein [unclassified Streptomyces]WLQ66825.1 TIM barrel protein [Streptomyces sp. Alt3]WSQ87574.1 sugar phosphate isomerase/epimerase and 4-hydroxyphenylpyruvate domain-containing protein [Streptomyces sp. NBC_01212]
MRTSIATVSLSGTLTEKLAAAARAGFDGVEIFENDLTGSPLSPEEIRERAADLGLTIDLYQPMRDIEAVPADEFARNLRRAEHKFRLMRRLGADTVLVCSSVSPYAVDDDTLAAGQLRRLADLAQESGIRVAYEALAWGRHVSTYEHAWRIVEAADHPALGVCLDSFHILARGSDLSGIEDIPGGKIFFLQLADAPQMALDVLQWSRHHRCFPGQGDLDVAALVRAAVRAGYDGPLSLEVFNDVFRQADAGRTAIDARRSLTLLQESAGVTAPPAPVVPTGFAFVEIATADTARIAPLLTALGFSRTARHSGKPVDLWEQGEARILLNTDTDTDTDTGSHRSGPSLTAVGLESPDPAGASARAESLLAPVLPRRRAPGDAPLDAVAAPDGTEFFFCVTERPGDTGHPGWTGDFVPAPHTPAPIGITRVDHVALSQPWHHFDEATLFHRGVLGLRPQASVDLADPYGLLRSRAVSNEDGTVRIALGVGASPGEDPARGGRPQHVALVTDDLVPTVRRALASGARMLPVPANYYDDLAAAHEFAPGELETYRELGILHDRDEKGEFRHCYTVTTGRVFFELVERVGGYDGYGARNAPVRLAAQHALAE